jgi:UDP-glucose:glycoprotein glucosyltransferase
MRRERGVVRALTGLGLSSLEAIDLLTHDSLAQAHSAGSFLDGFFDASDRPEGGDLVMWWNDIEKDSR